MFCGEWSPVFVWKVSKIVSWTGWTGCRYRPIENPEVFCSTSTLLSIRVSLTGARMENLKSVTEECYQE